MYNQDEILEEYPDEQAPLLSRPLTPTSSKDNDQDLYVLYVKICTIVLLINTGSMILAPAQTRIFEQIYCDQYYQKHPSDAVPKLGPAPERFCKLPVIQQEVAMLKGWYEFYDAIPGLLMAVPIGVLADTFGRRSCFIVSLNMIFLQQLYVTIVTWFSQAIPLRAIWLESLLNFGSGGPIVAEMLFVCIVVDTAPRKKLDNVFFYVGAVSQVARVLGPSVGALLMRRNPWLSVFTGLTLLFLSAAMTVLVPETLRQEHKIASIEEDAAGHGTLRVRFRIIVRNIAAALKELAFVWKDWRLIFLCLTITPIRVLSECLKDLVQRYASVRYNWTLARAASLYAMQACFASVVLFLILPRLSTLIDKRTGYTAIKKNLLLTRGATLMLALGFALEGFAPNIAILLLGLVIENLGTGFSASLRALVGALIRHEDSGRVFSVLAMSETLVKMLVYPALNWIFSIGLDHDNRMWLGLPYFVAAAVSAVALLAFCALRFEKKSIVVDQ